MQLSKYIPENTVSLVATAGAIVGVVTVAMNFDKIALTYRNMTANFEKKAVPPVQVTPPTTAENLGNVDKVYEAEQKDHTTNFSDVFNIPAGKNVTNAGNVKIVHKEKVEGGTTNLGRTFDLTK